MRIYVGPTVRRGAHRLVTASATFLLLIGLSVVLGGAQASALSSTYGTGPGFCSSVASGAYDLGASFDNVWACGPTPGAGAPGYGDAFESSPWGFQCTELANRFLWDAWGIAPIFGANLDGADFASTVHASHPSIVDVVNGTIGQPYLPGDIVSFAGNSYEPDGHVAVVIASSENSAGNGQVTVMEENASTSGSETLTVSNWLLEKAPGSYVTPTDFDALASVGPVTSSPAVEQIAAGALSRYAGANGHISTTGPAPSGYNYESTFGSLLTSAQPGTTQLFLCQLGTDYFSSTSTNCEGQQVVASEGWIYTSAPTNVPSVALYRCRVTSTGTHFDTTDPNCEGQSQDAGLLGYLVATAPLSRYAGANGHISTTGPAPSGYNYESTFGSLLTSAQPGTTQLFLCQLGTDYFSSTSTNCEGQQVVASEGWIYTSAPTNVPSVALYRCRVTSTGTHFDTTDPNCEGQSQDAGLLGYLDAEMFVLTPQITTTTTSTVAPTTTTSTVAPTTTTSTVAPTTTTTTTTSTTSSVTPTPKPERLSVNSMSFLVPHMVSVRVRRVAFRVVDLPRIATGFVVFDLAGGQVCRARVEQGSARCVGNVRFRRGHVTAAAWYSGDRRFRTRVIRVSLSVA